MFSKELLKPKNLDDIKVSCDIREKSVNFGLIKWVQILVTLQITYLEIFTFSCLLTG